MVQDFFKGGIDSNTVVQCLKCLSESKALCDEWMKVVGTLSGDEEIAASVILLQRVTSMFILYYNFTTQRVAGSPQQYKNQLLWALFYKYYINIQLH
jgi:hypothetical protein